MLVFKDHAQMVDYKTKFKRSYKDHKRVLGKKHPQTIQTLRQLAEFYSSACQFDKAKKLHGKTLRRSKRVLGKHHPIHIQSVESMFFHFHKQDDKVMAAKWALEVSCRRLGALGKA